MLMYKCKLVLNYGLRLIHNSSSENPNPQFKLWAKINSQIELQIKSNSLNCELIIRVIQMWTEYAL